MSLSERSKNDAHTKKYPPIRRARIITRAQ